MDSRSRILDAALRVFAETGYRGATTRRIAHEAEVNEVTLFRHFGSKEELIRAALLHAGGNGPEAVLPAHPADPRSELIAWARAQYQRLQVRGALIRTCMSECTEHPDMAACVNQELQELADELTRYFERLRAAEHIDRSANLSVAAAVLLSAVFQDATHRAVMPERFPFSARDAAARYVDLILRSVGAASGNVVSRG